MLNIIALAVSKQLQNTFVNGTAIANISIAKVDYASKQFNVTITRKKGFTYYLQLLGYPTMNCTGTEPKEELSHLAIVSFLVVIVLLTLKIIKNS